MIKKKKKSLIHLFDGVRKHAAEKIECKSL